MKKKFQKSYSLSEEAIGLVDKRAEESERNASDFLNKHLLRTLKAKRVRK